MTKMEVRLFIGGPFWHKDMVKTNYCILVSGGVDSMALMDLFSRLQLKASVLHFNHGLRGEESDQDAILVKKESKNRNYPCYIIELKLKAGTGIQLRAREERRRWITKLSKKHGWNVIVTAHHADDQLETVIMRMKRGAGDQGLRGMTVTRQEGHLTYFKPLLHIPKNDIRAYVQKFQIPFREDSSNQSKKYWRNQIRHEEIPELQKSNPDWARDLQLFSDQKSLIFQKDQHEAESFLKKQGIEILKKDYLQLEDNVRFLVLRDCLLQSGFTKQFTQNHFKEIEHLISRDKSCRREYGEVNLEMTKETFCFNSRALIPQTHNYSLIIRKKGVYFIEPIRTTITVHSGFFPLMVRFPQKGDRFRPARLKGHSQKLSDFFINHKVPRWKRGLTPLLTYQPKGQKEEIVAVGDLALAYDYQGVAKDPLKFSMAPHL